MRINRNKFVVGAGVLLCLFGLGALSGRGRSALRTMFSAARPAPVTRTAAQATATPRPTPTVSATPVWQRAMAAHGWTTSIQNSVATGSINFFDTQGHITEQGTIKIYRLYPSNVRVEITTGGKTQVQGFGFNNAWNSQFSSLTADQARDAREWTRICPERLFVSVAAGMGYRETHPISQDHRPQTPEGPATNINPPLVFNQAEVIDQLGALGSGGIFPDQRRIDYLVNTVDSLINSAYWLEPDDPTQPANNPNTNSTAIRVDYGDWHKIDGVIWPFSITHWFGGTVDYEVQLTGIETNQSLGSGLFQHP